jgi:hypothetical protein
MLKDKVIKFYVEIDDFYKQFLSEMKNYKKLEETNIKRRNRAGKLTDTEMMSIILLFQSGGFSNFKNFYNDFVKVYLADLFPELISYERFVKRQERLFLPLLLFLKHRGLGKCTGINFIDSTKIEACEIQREKQHKVLKNFAEKGKTTTGWFFGFKLHLIINDKGQILSFYLTKGNVDDRDIRVLSKMTQDIFGKLFGDRGYISKALSELLFQDGIQLITKVRKNMKQQNLSDIDAILLRKRSVIESVNDELKTICKLQHTRHRSINGFLLNLVSALVAYHFLPKKPSLKITPFEQNPNQMSIFDVAA